MRHVCAGNGRAGDEVVLRAVLDVGRSGVAAVRRARPSRRHGWQAAADGVTAVVGQRPAGERGEGLVWADTCRLTGGCR